MKKDKPEPHTKFRIRVNHYASRTIDSVGKERIDHYMMSILVLIFMATFTYGAFAIGVAPMGFVCGLAFVVMLGVFIFEIVSDVRSALAKDDTPNDPQV